MPPVEAQPQEKRESASERRSLSALCGGIAAEILWVSPYFFGTCPHNRYLAFASFSPHTDISGLSGATLSKLALMHVISRDSPCYFLTSVAKNRLPVFRTHEMSEIACKALDESRKSGKFALYAYVLIPDHLHVITDSARSSEDTLRFINGIIGHRVISYLKERGYESSLQKLRQETKRRKYKHSLWDHHPNVRLLHSEKMLMERVHYLHENPVRAGLVERAEDYRYSSVRCWNGQALDDEPLLVDNDRIKWRRG